VPPANFATLEKKAENRDHPGAQISDECIAAARAGRAEGLLRPIPPRLDHPDGSAIALSPAEEILARKRSLAIRMAA
jgi:hypothetical protein